MFVCFCVRALNLCVALFNVFLSQSWAPWTRIQRQVSFAGCRLQVAGCRLQVAGCRLQVAGCRLQVAGWNLIAIGTPLALKIINNPHTGQGFLHKVVGVFHRVLLVQSNTECQSYWYHARDEFHHLLEVDIELLVNLTWKFLAFINLVPRVFSLACGRDGKRPWHRLVTCPPYTLKSWV